MWKYIFFLIIILIFSYSIFMSTTTSHEPEKNESQNAGADLTAEQRYILFEEGTEPPFSSDLLKEKRTGTYYAADTKKPVFRSEDKYDSGTGWPSFTKPIASDAVQEHADNKLGMTRTEVTSTEGGHLGHVFTDGPEDKGGLRYCINGDALYFVPDEESQSSE